MSQGEFKAVHLSAPSFLLCTFPPGSQVGLEFIQPEDHPWFHMQHGAANAGVFVCTRRAIGLAAGTEFDLAFVEVFLEFFPFGLSYLPICGPYRPGTTRRCRKTRVNMST
jgi:hypothetical protein